MPFAAQAVLDLLGLAPGAARPADARQTGGPSFEDYIRIVARGGRSPNAASADAVQATPALAAVNASAAQSTAAISAPFALTMAATTPAATGPAPVFSPDANAAPADQLPMAPSPVLQHARDEAIATAVPTPAAPASTPAPDGEVATPAPGLAAAPAQSPVRGGEVTPAIPNQQAPATPASAAAPAAALAPARTRETSFNPVAQRQPDPSPAAQSAIAASAASATPSAAHPAQPRHAAGAPNATKPAQALIDSASAPAQTIALPQIATPLSEALALRATTQPTSGPRGNAAPAQTSPAAPPAPPLTPRELAAAKAQAPVIEFRPEGGRPGPNRPAAASQSAEKAGNNTLPLAGASADAAPLKLASSADITVSAQQLPIPGSTSTSHVQHALVAEHAARSAPAVAQVGREIVRRFDGENTRFELRLDPPELGRIEVRLEVTRDHRVTAVVAADNAQALSELTRNARDLEQTLQSAGLELGENGLSFDLRRGGDETAEADAGRSAGADGAMNDDQPGETVLARPVGFERWRGVRLDLMV